MKGICCETFGIANSATLKCTYSSIQHYSLRLRTWIVPWQVIIHHLSGWASGINFGFVSVEAIATENLVDVQFKSLRESIHVLQQASIALDEEKHKVSKDFRKLIRNLKKHKKLLKKLYCRIKKLFGRKCSCPHKKISITAIGEQEESSKILGLAVHSGYRARSNVLPHPGKAVNHLRKLAKRIQVLNAKSSAFERGFISAEGIKDREWYKHLAVAPGKWLG